MSHDASVKHEKIPDPHQDAYSMSIYGFWVYLMTDCILFGSLFATYVVLHNNTFGGPSSHELFSLPYVLTETIILLVSSFTCGLATLAARRHDKNAVIGWFAITFLLGASFVGLELHEFAGMVREGNSWQRSGFLSSYFTLVGTHGSHITVGLFWMIIFVAQLWKRGFTVDTLKRLTCLSLFWHFLDVVWIFIYTIVYLMGVS